MSEQCRHSSTAKRPTRKKEEESTSTKAALHNFSKKHSLTSTSPHLPGGLHVSPQRHQLRRRHVTGDRHHPEPAGEASAPGQPGLPLVQWEGSMWPWIGQSETRKPRLLLPGQWVTSEQGGEKPLSLFLCTHSRNPYYIIIISQTENISHVNCGIGRLLFREVTWECNCAEAYQWLSNQRLKGFRWTIGIVWFWMTKQYINNPLEIGFLEICRFMLESV